MNNIQNDQNQDIDLSVISKNISNFFDGISLKIFKFMLFIKKNIIILCVLFFGGVILGFVLDRTKSNYQTELIVTPNFDSFDYMSEKVAFLQSKLMLGDSVFFKSIGVKKFNKLAGLKLEPINDVYSFINRSSGSKEQTTLNFEMIKLLAEDGDINKILKDEMTSKNFSSSLITIYSEGKASDKELVTPLMNYINSSDYYQKIQKIEIENTNTRIAKNQETINQIDALLAQFTNSNANQKNNNLVYYNENNNLNDILNTKEKLILDNNYLRIHLVDITEIVKVKSKSLNLVSYKGIVGKLKLILPVLFVFFFFVFIGIRNFYTNQKQKLEVN